MLRPNLMLDFKSNQFFQARKYKAKLKEMNKNYLRFFSLVVGLYYVIQTVLHITIRSGVVFLDNSPQITSEYSSDQENRKFAVVDCDRSSLSRCASSEQSLR